MIDDADVHPEMKLVLACVYSNFTTTIVDDGGIQQRDAYTAPPIGEKLVVQLERLSNQ